MKPLPLLALALLLAPLAVPASAGPALDQAAGITAGSAGAVYDGSGGVGAAPSGAAGFAGTSASAKSGGGGSFLGQIGDVVGNGTFLTFAGWTLLGAVMGFAVGAAVVGAGPALLLGAAAGLGIAALWTSIHK